MKRRIHEKTAEFPVLRKRTWLQTDTFYFEQHLQLNCQSVRKSCVHFCQWIMWNIAHFLPTENQNPGNCYFMGREKKNQIGKK